ncbi:MAG TPA: hypothetical protein VNN73_08070 [Blastocatellia bacterium]|nr:hypothetical protein [Blastocatellia bacterium]
MTLYCWNSFERRFIPTHDREHIPSGERVLLRSLEIGKGERVTGEATSGEQFICILRGAWRMKIAGNLLTVRDSEAVIIPSGFKHSAEAIEDSFALQMVREREPNEDYLWGV